MGLAAVVAVLGPAVVVIPLEALRLLVGGLLLIFGLQWLRKAILRASGNKALHDEAAEYEATVALAQHAEAGRRGLVPDWYGFTLAFKAVTLEGLEVAFIALTFGANQHNVPLAAAAAVAAVVVVALAGVALRAPLARVPENTVKFIVGVLLTAFGLFWSAEGAGAHWPGGDVALLYLVPAVAAYAVYWPWCSDVARTTRADSGGGRMIGAIRSFARFWYDFIVGDDWRVALGVVVSLAITAIVAHTTAIPTWWIVLAALAILLPMSIHRVARRAQRPPAPSPK